jgi:hypothetical protein
MKRVVVLVGALAALAAPSAGAVNDPIVPGDNCAPANAQAVGHPAAANNQTPDWAANPLFSVNNPGVSTGAQGSARAGPGCPADT